MKDEVMGGGERGLGSEAEGHEGAELVQEALGGVRGQRNMAEVIVVGRGIQGEI